MISSLLCTNQVMAASVNITNAGFEDNFNGWTDNDPSSVSGVAFQAVNQLKFQVAQVA